MSASFFQNAQNFSINNAHFVNNPQILNFSTASIPEAAHDSSARHPPPLCHPGTRQDYIAKIIHWSLHHEDRKGRMLWMYGPAGVGKSAVAQTSAEKLGDKLGAAFFFRINLRDDPTRFFTTVAYQLAIKFTSYGDILARRIRQDPSLVSKAITQQFESLIVTPIRELRDQGIDIGELIVIIDGLDECATIQAQREIVEIIARSIQERSTPLLWLFFSRPEPHITTTFTLPHVSPISFHLELPVSRDVDIEITLYLNDELGKIGREHCLPASWPSEADIGTLINLCAGLFIYASTIVRFIGSHDSLGPEDQLAAVLRQATKSAGVLSSHPLSELDALYILIMERIPPQVLLVTQKILILTSFELGNNARTVANVLNLSESQYRHACRNLHSVLKISHEDKGNQGQLFSLSFYHASFMQFMWDRSRSGKFCLTSECAVTLRNELLEKLNKVHTDSDIQPLAGKPCVKMELIWKGEEDGMMYLFLVRAFLILCQSILMDVGMSKALDNFDYSPIPRLAPWNIVRIRHLEEPKSEEKLNNIPKRPFHKMFLFRWGICKRPNFASVDFPPYVLGRGKNKVLCWPVDGDVLERDALLLDYPRVRDIVRRKFKARESSESG